MHIDPKDLQFTNIVIRAETKKLQRRSILHSDEMEPFASEVLARLLAVWKSYDPTRGPREAFINTVVSNLITSLLRERYAQKRRGTTQPIESVADLLVDRATSEESHENVINLRIDLSEVIPRLTTFQREIVELLQRDALTTVAGQLGIPRRTLRDQCARIREVFRDAGLEKYM